MAATEIHYSEQHMAFLVAWRRPFHPRQYLCDETGRSAYLQSEQELPGSPHRHFTQRTIDALMQKFAHVDDVFRELE